MAKHSIMQYNRTHSAAESEFLTAMYFYCPYLYRKIRLFKSNCSSSVTEGVDTYVIMTCSTLLSSPSLHITHSLLPSLFFQYPFSPADLVADVSKQKRLTNKLYITFQYHAHVLFFVILNVHVAFIYIMATYSL